MRTAAERSFLPITLKLEGKTPFQYNDIKGFITTGVGSLVDLSEWDDQLGHTVPPGYAALKAEAMKSGQPIPPPSIAGARPWAPTLPLPWLRVSDNEPASEREKIIEWCWIWGSNTPDEPLDYSPKSNPFRRQRLFEAQRGGFYFQKFCKLYLSEEGIHDLVFGKLAQNESHLRRRFSDFDAWPAAAQLTLHLWAWAVGPAARFPRFEAHLRKKEFAIYASMPDGKQVLVSGAAVESHIDDSHNAGVKPRNAILRALFEEAQAVQMMGLDPDALFYPSAVGSGNESPSVAPPAPSPDDTVPHAPPPEDTLRGLGTQNPDFINEAVKATQREADEKRGRDE